MRSLRLTKPYAGRSKHRPKLPKEVESECDFVIVNKLNEVILKVNNIEAKLQPTNNEREEICAEIIETNNMCDYCKEQSTCESEHKNNVACGYFVGRKLSPIS